MPPTTAAPASDRIARLEVRVDTIDELRRQDRQHIDEIMALHKSTHADEHHVRQESLGRAEAATALRIEALAKTVERIGESLAALMPREYAEQRFAYFDEWVRRVETDGNKNGNLLATISSARTAERDLGKENRALWLTISLAAVSLLANVVLSLVALF